MDEKLPKVKGPSVEVLRVRREDDYAVIGSASVRINGLVTIHELRIVQDINGIHVMGPRKGGTRVTLVRLARPWQKPVYEAVLAAFNALPKDDSDMEQLSLSRLGKSNVGSSTAVTV